MVQSLDMTGTMADTPEQETEERMDTPADHVRQYEARRDVIKSHEDFVPSASGQLSQDEHQVLAYRTSRRVYPVLTYQQFELIHAVLGLASELGEIADTVKKHVIYQQPLDSANITEEVGDFDWYAALLLTAIGELRSIAMAGNITKLRKRYPEGYSDLAAISRADKHESTAHQVMRVNGVCTHCEGRSKLVLHDDGEPVLDATNQPIVIPCTYCNGTGRT